MAVTRRRTLGILGSILAAPVVLRSDPAHAATIVPLNDIAIGDNLTGGKRLPRLVPRSSGDIGAIAINVAPDQTSRVFARNYTLGGLPASPLTFIDDPDSPPTGSDGSPVNDFSCAVTPNGRVFALLSAQQNNQPGSITGINVYSQFLDENMELTGRIRRVNTVLSGAQTLVLAARLTTGKYAAVWRSLQSDPDSGNVVGNVVEPDGTVPDADVIVAGGPGSQTPASIAALGGGRWVFGFYRDFAGARQSRMQIMSGRTPVGTPILLKNSGTDFTTVGVGSDGVRIIVASFDPVPNANGEHALRVRIFDRNGALQSNRTIGSSAIDVTRNSAPRIAPAAGGGFAIVTDGRSGTERTLDAWFVRASGVGAAGPTALHSSDDVLEATAVIQATNGHFWAAWTEATNLAPTSQTAHAKRFRLSGL